jgi:hypothetical protein
MFRIFEDTAPIVSSPGTSAWIAAGAAIVSSLIAAGLAFFGFIERGRERKRDTMLKALEYLTGGSQNRSVGVALIEGLWFQGHPFEEAIVPALVNQAVYLLLGTDSGARRDQIHSWKRIMRLILSVPPRDRYRDLYLELAEGLEQRASQKEMPKKGIEIEAETSRHWLERVNAHYVFSARPQD